MSGITEIAPEVLKYRHRLSSHQINAIYGKKVIEESYEEKVAILNKAGELVKVGNILKTAGIEFIPLKGPLLSYRLYGDASARKSGDIDILLDAGDVDRGLQSMLGAGYKEYMFTWPSTERAREKALKYRHHISLTNPEGDVIVEVHWVLTNRQWLNFTDAEEFVRGNLCTVEFSGNTYRVLSPEAELLYLVIHGGVHRWGMLKWLEDISRYLEKIPFDPVKFCNLVNLFGCGRMVTLCNRMLSRFYPGNISLPCGSRLPGYIERMALEAIERPFTRGPVTVIEIFRLLPYSLGVYPGLRYKLRVLWEVAGGSLFNGRLRRFLD